MARPDRFDEYEEEYERDRPPPRGSSPVLIIALVLVGGMLLAGCLVVGGFALLWSQVESDRRRPAGAEVGPVNTEAGKPADGTRRVYTRPEFRDLVTGKTPAEVRALLGPPKRESESPDRVVWVYEGRTTDLAASKLDREAQVVFENGRVVRVDY